MDLISVIIPVYQAEPYLKQCIESVTEQTYSNLEIILVDDGSPDRCPQICDDFAARDVRVKVIHKMNGGLSNARNAGLDIASGDWIAFIDSDDYMRPTMLQSLHDVATAQGADMAVCNALFFNNSGETWTPDWFNVENTLINGIEVLKTGHIPTSLVVAWNKLYRRKIFTTLRYPAGRIHEDEAVAHEILGMCNKIACIGENLYFYRQHSKSITKKQYNAKRLDVILAMADRVMYYQKNGLKEYSEPVLDDFCWHLMDKFYRVSFDWENQRIHRQCLGAARSLLPYYIRTRKATVREKIGYGLFCVSPKLYRSLLREHEL